MKVEIESNQQEKNYTHDTNKKINKTLPRHSCKSNQSTVLESEIHHLVEEPTKVPINKKTVLIWFF